MNRRIVRSILVVTLLAMLAGLGDYPANQAAAQGAVDLYMKDTPLDSGVEPNPDPGPMFVSEDIWVRTTPDPNYRPQPFPEASPSWTPLPHENPEYRDPLFSTPNYVYVRVRNRGGAASSGTETLKLYWAKASTGLAWPAQWVDYVVNSGGGKVLYGAEVTKPRKNAATATKAERDAYVKAIKDVGTLAQFVYPGGASYWHQQNLIHALSAVQSSAHIQPAFLPWHREMLSRYEILLQKADPTVKLLYWDWTKDPANQFGSPLPGFNYFTSDFMGASGRGTGGVSIGAPFMPDLGPSVGQPDVSRNLQNNAPPATSDVNILSVGAGDLPAQPVSYQSFRTTIEFSPNHNATHNYFQGTVTNPFTAARDPFFFLLHGNVDRLWAQWQRANLRRMDATQAYGNDQLNGNITGTMPPWNGTGNLRPWALMPNDGFIVNKTSLNPSLVTPPVYDVAPLTIPVLQPGEAVVIQIPWYPPNPADFPTFGDPGHVCLLARIETSSTAPFGMTFPEGNDVGVNTRNNNNIVWKNVTVVDSFPGALRLSSILIRNIFDELVFAGLRFSPPQDFSPPFFEFGRIEVDLGEELYARWLEGGAVGKGIEPVGGTRIQLFSTDASIENLPLEPGETFPVDIHFELFDDYKAIPDVFPKLDMLQVGSPEDPEAVVGGNRFVIDINQLVPVEAGGEWRYLDGGADPGAGWQAPDYDDSRWKLGQADLGFGYPATTIIDGGPPENRPITAYFRKSFDVADPGFFHNLYLRLRRNDGAVVYLNGEEIHRVNLPGGAVSPGTQATRDVVGLEREVFFPVEVNPGLLLPGNNVIAAEVHLASPTSQDLSFDLELFANPVKPLSPPQAAFINPIEGDLIQAGQAIPIEVEALDGDGSIVSVSVFADGVLLGTDEDAPYTFEWSGAGLGSHVLQARALDNDGQQVTVDAAITVLANTPPFVSLTLPLEGAVFHAGDPIPASAQATDEGGAVSKVEFYVASMDMFANPRLVGSDAEAPYSISVALLPPGHYILYAVAVDDDGAFSESVPVHIEVHGTLIYFPFIGADRIVRIR